VRGATIEVRRVSKRCGDVCILHDVSFAVEAGTLVTLLGPSGCGKSTTLRLIAGLDFATAGTIVIDGVDVSGRSPGERHVAMVFPGSTLFAHLTVRENVAHAVRARADAAARAQRVLETVGLGALGDRLPSELSSGQLQRVAVARALVLEPAVLLFDEPLSNLDAGLRRHVRAEIRGLQQQLGLTVVYVTHDQAEAMAVADQIIVMNRGVIAQDGTPRALYEAPASEFVATFLGEASCVEGCLETRTGDTGMVRLGPLRIRVPHREQPIGPVAVAIRPEAVAIGPKGSGSLAATVRKAAYLGAVVEYTLATEIGELFVIDRDARVPLAPGDAAGLTLLDRGVVILPRDRSRRAPIG
jgi:iron(III) transport system ATP-binding protein